jgi:hypothetical protein
MWRLPETCGYSYLRVAAIQIDVHTTGENLINMTRTLPMPVHVCHAYAFCWQSPYMATFHTDPTEVDRFTAPDSTCQQGWVARGARFSFSHNTIIEAVCLSQTTIEEKDTRLTGLISPACDQYVQYLPAGANPSVLNQHRWGLQPCRCHLATSHSLTFPTDGLPRST